MRKRLIALLCGLLTLALSPSATAIPTLTLTESGNTLTWSWDNGLGNGTLTSTLIAGYQGWYLTGIPRLQNFDIANHFVVWTEPDNPSAVNRVFLSNGFPTDPTINLMISDVPLSVYGGSVRTVSDGNTVQSYSGTFAIRVVDRGDTVVSTPDSGSTLLLLLPAFCGPLLMTRRLNIGRGKGQSVRI